MTKVTVALGSAGSIEVQTDKFNESVREYIFMYGLKQMLNDKHASEKDSAAKLGLVQKKLDSLYRGEVAQARVGGGDPVAKEMAAMALRDVKAAIAKAGKKVKDFKPEALQAVVAKQVAANEAKYRKAAEAKLAIKPEAQADADDILAMLG